MDNQRVFVGIGSPHFEISSLFVFLSYFLYRLFANLSLAPVIRAFCVSVHADDKHDLYATILAWVSRHRARSRHLKLALSKPHYQRNTDEDTTKALTLIQKKTNKELARIELFYGTQIFFHRKRLFFFKRVQQQEKSIHSDEKEEYIILATLGWSNEPIIRLLQDIIDEEEERNPSISVFITRSKHERRYMRNPWEESIQMIPRPISTVILDQAKLAYILQDMKEYLSADSVRWYANKGIPHRRGYLFEGPAGAGKTSLAVALAGFFRLDIYILNVADSGMNDTDLLKCFHRIPRHCVVILEDIDAAKLGANSLGAKRESSRTDDTSASENLETISLAGLLNAIDGVASPEHRILIMTTNYREKLEDALIRPGRVDIKIEFSLIRRPEMRAMFLRLYEGHTTQNIIALADQFADKLPDEKLSAAEIQGFLISRRLDPHQAVREVEAWCLEEMAAKKRYAVASENRREDDRRSVVVMSGDEAVPL